MTFRPNANALEALERERLRAIVAVDEETFWSLHDPEFVLCSPGGTIWNRSTYVGGLIDGSISYSRFEPVTAIEVLGEMHAEVAAVRYRSVIDVVTPRGGGHLECWHLDVYVRDLQDGWRCRWSQATDTISE